MKKFKRIISAAAALAMSVSLLTAPTRAADTALFSVDFDNKNTVTSTDAAYSTAGGIRAWGGGTVVDGVGYDKTKAFVLNYNNSNLGRAFVINLAASDLTSGQYRLTYDFLPSSNTNALAALYGTNKEDAAKKTYMYAGAKFARIWYSAEILADLDQDKITVTLTGKGDASKKYTYTKDYAKNLRAFIFEQNAPMGADTSAIFDNFVFTQPELPISISKSNVTVTDKFGAVASDLSAVNPAVASISINFGKAINQATLTSDKIKLVGPNNEEIACTRQYTDGVYTLKPSAAVLSGESEYTIVISEGIESADGVAVEAANVGFTTAAAETDIVGSDCIADFDFDSCASISDLPACADYANETGTNGWKTWGGNEIVSGGRDGSGKAFKIGMTSWTDRTAEYFLPSAVSLDKVKIEASVKPSSAQKYFIVGIFDGARSSSNAVFTAAGALTGTAKNSLLAGTNNWTSTKDYTDYTVNTGWTDQWYDVTALLDFEMKQMDVTVKSKDGTIDFSGTYALALAKLSGIQFTSSGKAGNGDVLIDNFKIYKVYDAAPTLSPDSFKIYAADGIQTNLNSVSSYTDRVCVDFGQSMKTDDMSGSNIYVTEKGSDTKLTTLDSYGNGIYTMVFAELLKAKTSYTVHVKPVANVSGFATAEEYTLDFTVGEGTYKSQINQMIIGGTKVTSPSAITAGTAAQIEFDYFNSYNNEQTLYVIAAYYNDDTLVKADYVTYTGPASITSGTYRVDYQIPSDLPEFDDVKIMSWDGFETMIPLGGFLDIR